MESSVLAPVSASDKIFSSESTSGETEAVALDAPVISVIVPARNCREELRQCLEASVVFDVP